MREARMVRGWLRGIGDDIAAVTIRIEQDDTFPILGQRRRSIVVNRRQRP